MKVNGSATLRVVYAPPPDGTIAVRSKNPNDGVRVHVSIPELSMDYKVKTPYDLEVSYGVNVNLLALDTQDPEYGGTFVEWRLNGEHYSSTVFANNIMLSDQMPSATAKAVYPDRFTFTPDPVGPLCPAKVGQGDDDFAGNGPAVTATASLFNSFGQLAVELTLHAKETKSDWTEAYREWPSIVLTNFNNEYVEKIVTPCCAVAKYTDNDHDYDNIYPSGNGPVRRFKIMGDTDGADVGACTTSHVHMTVYFKPITVLLRPLGSLE